jgi:hypothetical protein
MLLLDFNQITTLVALARKMRVFQQGLAAGMNFLRQHELSSRVISTRYFVVLAPLERAISATAVSGFSFAIC